jgi:hypothetical protein
VAQQVRVLQGTAQVPLEHGRGRQCAVDDLAGAARAGRRVLSRLDVESEVAAGDLAFTRSATPCSNR